MDIYLFQIFLFLNAKNKCINADNFLLSVTFLHFQICYIPRTIEYFLTHFQNQILIYVLHLVQIKLINKNNYIFRNYKVIINNDSYAINNSTFLKSLT